VAPAGGCRDCDREHGRRLRFIPRARDLGFGVEEIRGLPKLVDREAYTCAQVRGITLEHRDAVRLEIAGPKRLERTLARTVAACKWPERPGLPGDLRACGGLISEHPENVGFRVRPLRHFAESI